ncbi:MAG TPA: hypothetical protein VE174_02930 [Actinomycetota bacterium]|nr:hypothetical protein [Actinomycetota bacterium]
MTRSPLVRLSWVAAVGFFVVLGGVWPFLAPRSFFDALVAFPPFNAHLLRDIGSFQLGIGGALLAAAKWRDGLLVALTGAAVAGVFHVVSHIVDSNKGGNPTDIPLLALLAIFLVVGAFARAKEVRT